MTLQGEGELTLTIGGDTLNAEGNAAAAEIESSVRVDGQLNGAANLLREPIEVAWVKIGELNAHPLHGEIFRQEDIRGYAKQMAESGRDRMLPLLVDEQNVILGDHRGWMSAALLGWAEVPVIYVRLDGDDEEKEAFLVANYQRQWTVEERVRGGLVWEDIIGPLAEKRMLAGKAVEGGKENGPEGNSADYGPNGQLRDQVAARVGFGCGKNYSKAKTVVRMIDQLEEEGKTVEAEGLRRLLNLVSVSKASAFENALRNLDAGSMDALEVLAAVGKMATTGDPGKGLLSKAEKEVRESRQSRIPNDLPACGQLYEVHEGDLLEVGGQLKKQLLVLRDVCILTDLPYTSQEDHEGLGVKGDTYDVALEKLCQFCTDYMPDDSFAVVLVGQHHLDEVFHILRGFTKLRYYWTITIIQPGGSPKLHGRNVNAQWKGAIVITKGQYRGDRFNDVIYSEPLRKHLVKLHVWQQSEVPFANMLTEMTRPGWTVVDPFCGSASVGAAAMKLSRRYIGIDIEPAAVKVARNRLLSLSKELDDTRGIGADPSASNDADATFADAVTTEPEESTEDGQQVEDPDLQMEKA